MCLMSIEARLVVAAKVSLGFFGGAKVLLAAQCLQAFFFCKFHVLHNTKVLSAVT